MLIWILKSSSLRDTISALGTGLSIGDIGAFCMAGCLYDLVYTVTHCAIPNDVINVQHFYHARLFILLNTSLRGHILFRLVWFRVRLMQQGPAVCEFVMTATVTEKSVMPDPHEP